MNQTINFYLLLVGLLIGSQCLAASNSSLKCYEFDTLDVPAAIDLKALSTGGDYSHRWCYQENALGHKEYIFIFNMDSGAPKPELSALIRLDPHHHAVSISIGSLSLGKVKFQLLSELALNPFSIPLLPEQARLVGRPISAPGPLDLSSLNTLAIQHAVQSSASDKIRIKTGNFGAHISPDQEPFNGFWWSDEGVPMATGPNSPLGIYDASIAARTGTNPNSVEWENANHSDTSNAWGGHCNGWAASTVLYKEPRSILFDPLTHRVVTPYAQKGMLAEASFCVNEAFYGKRYYGKWDDLLDIYPDLFHKVLIQYIGTLGKAVAMDYVRGVEVDNNVISGYQFHIVKTGHTSTREIFHVNAVLTVAQYDIEQRDSLGKAGTYQKSYSYSLITDLNGNILSGKWDKDSDNPDFLWVPLSISEHCSPRNPRIDPTQMTELLNSLPEANAHTLPLNFVSNLSLIPQGQVPIPLQVEAGDQMKLKISVRSITPAPNPEFSLIASGDARYPVTGGEKESMFIPLNIGDSVIPLDRLLSIDSIAIVNQSMTLSYTADLTVEALDYLAQ